MDVQVLQVDFETKNPKENQKKRNKGHMATR